MSDEILIKAENVGKKFCRNLKKSLIYGVQDVSYDLLGKNRSEAGLRKDEFWANQGISFELKRGECLGLIGHNGAGKTTLLKMLNGLIKPDQGSITMHGRVGALIALGAGFNPILTGRENIYINGSVLGLSRKEIEAKIDEIIDFAEIPDFIDTPVQNYSSGMTVRLGFAVASSLNPDILLLDEVLAVGDMSFVIKCLNRVNELMENSAVILVSHRMQFITKFCTRILLLDHGQVEMNSDDLGGAIELYMKNAPTSATISGSGGVKIHSMALFKEGEIPDEENADSPLIDAEASERIILDVDFSIEKSLVNVVMTVALKNSEMNTVLALRAKDADHIEPIYRKGRHRIQFPINNPGFTTGKYSVLLLFKDRETQDMMLRIEGERHFVVKGHSISWSPLIQNVTVKTIS